jgi:hypothetical protein
VEERNWNSGRPPGRIIYFFGEGGIFIFPGKNNLPPPPKNKIYSQSRNPK